MLIKIKNDGVWKTFKSGFEENDFVTLKPSIIESQGGYTIGIVYDIQFNTKGNSFLYGVSDIQGKHYHYADELVKIVLEKKKNTGYGNR